MKRLGFFLLNIAVALYLLVNGILGFSNIKDKEFYTLVHTLGLQKDFEYALIIVLSICAIIAGILLLVSVFRNDVLAINIILFVFIALWVAFIVIVDVFKPIRYGISPNEFLDYLQRLSTHLMILGALFTSTKHFGRIYYS